MDKFWEYYKGYIIEEAIYMHDEVPYCKYWIVRDGIICGGCDTVERAKWKIDNDCVE